MTSDLPMLALRTRTWTTGHPREMSPPCRGRPAGSASTHCRRTRGLPMQPGRAAAWWSLLGVVACSDTGIPQLPNGVVGDSAGVRIVANSVPLWGLGDSWLVTSEPLLSLGVVDTTPLVQQFHHIEGVTRLGDGTIVVLNTGSGQLRAFDSTGKHLWSAGGLGFGPGEMNDHRGKRLVRLPGDALLVVSELDRIIFDSDGQLVDHRREPEENGCMRLTIPGAGDQGQSGLPATRLPCSTRATTHIGSSIGIWPPALSRWWSEGRCRAGRGRRLKSPSQGRGDQTDPCPWALTRTGFPWRTPFRSSPISFLTSWVSCGFGGSRFRRRGTKASHRRYLLRMASGGLERSGVRQVCTMSFVRMVCTSAL